MSTSPSEPETTPEEYRQRALLFADLGRYDEAAGEIAAGLSAAPEDPALLATLARIHLAADQPAEALVAADRAVQAGPGEINTLVVRAMALADNRRFGDAAAVATEILRRWPQDPYAQRTGAALLSESRNGQEALNAAWNGVRVAPTDAESHLVLAVVAARLRLFDLAQRAYSEALDLNEAIGEAQSDVGIVRLERRRWALALEALADEAALGTAGSPGPPSPSGSPSPPGPPGRTGPPGRSGPAAPPGSPGPSSRRDRLARPPGSSADGESRIRPFPPDRGVDATSGANSASGPSADPTAGPDLGPVADSKPGPTADPAAGAAAGSAAGPASDPTADPVTGPAADSAAGPGADLAAGSVSGPGADLAGGSTADPAADSASGSHSAASGSAADPDSGAEPGSDSGTPSRSRRSSDSGYPVSGPPGPPSDPEFPRPYPAPDRPEPDVDAYDPALAARGDIWNAPPSIARPTAPVLDPSGDSADGVRQAVLYGANGAMIAALLTALMATASGGASRVWAALVSVILFVAVLVWLSRRLTEPLANALGRMRKANRSLAGAAYLTFVAPILIMVYALVGGLIPLVAAIVIAALAEVLVITRR